jgi:hypothetical protein
MIKSLAAATLVVFGLLFHGGAATSNSGTPAEIAGTTSNADPLSKILTVVNDYADCLDPAASIGPWLRRVMDWVFKVYALQVAECIMGHVADRRHDFSDCITRPKDDSSPAMRHAVHTASE